MNGNIDVFAKSGMVDIEPDYSGRPFGGVSSVCKRNDNFTCRELDIPSDKTIAICISDSNGKPVQIILNVYMPFFNSPNKIVQSYKRNSL